MKKSLIAAVAALSLASAAPAFAQSVEADPFAVDQASIPVLAGLGTAGAVVSVVVAIVVVSTVLEAINNDDDDAAGTTGSTSASTTN